MSKRKLGEDGEIIEVEDDTQKRKWFWIGVATPIIVAVIGAIALVVTGNNQVIVNTGNFIAGYNPQVVVDNSVASTLTALPSQTPLILTAPPEFIQVTVPVPVTVKSRNSCKSSGMS